MATPRGQHGGTFARSVVGAAVLVLVLATSPPLAAAAEEWTGSATVVGTSSQVTPHTERTSGFTVSATTSGGGSGTGTSVDWAEHGFDLSCETTDVTTNTYSGGSAAIGSTGTSLAILLSIDGGTSVIEHTTTGSVEAGCVPGSSSSTGVAGGGSWGGNYELLSPNQEAASGSIKLVDNPGGGTGNFSFVTLHFSATRGCTGVDSDGDGITDCDEIGLGTSPSKRDSDDDTVDDGEDAFPLDPGESVDTDGDSVGNNADPDDDDDGFSDEEEIAAGSDPLDPGSTPGGSTTCDGIVASDVDGEDPTYRDASTLASFPNDDAVCDAVWVPTINDGFVPQGLALTDDGTTALISGYVQGTEPECRVVGVDLATGDAAGTFDFADFASTTGCKHGGGIQFDDQGRVWVVDTARIYALDHATLFSGGNPLRRTVRLGDTRVGDFKGSIAADGAGGTTLWIGEFKKVGLVVPSTMYEFNVPDLFPPQPIKSIEKADAIDQIEIPSGPQGADFHSPGLWVSSSTSKCGVLNNGTRYGFAPGSEGIQFDQDGTLWAVSEAGSSAFSSTSPLFPVIASFDASLIDKGPKKSCLAYGQTLPG